jgi:hypothetical protein
MPHGVHRPKTMSTTCIHVDMFAPHKDDAPFSMQGKEVHSFMHGGKVVSVWGRKTVGNGVDQFSHARLCFLSDDSTTKIYMLFSSQIGRTYKDSKTLPFSYSPSNDTTTSTADN